MSAGWGHVEIVASDAEQPTHVRTRAGNGEPLAVSEQLGETAGALRNIVAQAKVFGYDQPHVVVDPDAADGFLLMSGLSVAGRAQLFDSEVVIARIQCLDLAKRPTTPAGDGS